MALTPKQRARVAALAQWARTPDPAARLANAHAPFKERTPESPPGRFEFQVDPELKYPPEVRARMAESARKLYFTRLGLASGQARRERAAKRAGGDGTT